MNEAETRAEHIDPALKAAGWCVVEGNRILREYYITPGRIGGHGKLSKLLIEVAALIVKDGEAQTMIHHPSPLKFLNPMAGS
jgi:type I restriction enzyme R subunit